MFPNAPRRLVVLLAAVVAGRLLEGLFIGSFTYAVLWAVLLGALSVRALQGVHVAAKILGYIYYVFGAASLVVPLLGVMHSAMGIAVSVLWGVLALATARFLLSSQEAREFFSRSASENGKQQEA